MEPKSQVELLHEISNIVSSNLSLEKMLQELIGLAVEVTACDACLVYLVDRSRKEIVLRASQLPHTKEIGHIKLKMGEGITGWVAQNKSVVALGSNAAADSRLMWPISFVCGNCDARSTISLRLLSTKYTRQASQ